MLTKCHNAATKYYIQRACWRWVVSVYLVLWSSRGKYIRQASIRSYLHALDKLMAKISLTSRSARVPIVPLVPYYFIWTSTSGATRSRGDLRCPERQPAAVCNVRLVRPPAGRGLLEGIQSKPSRGLHLPRGANPVSVPEGPDLAHSRISHPLPRPVCLLGAACSRRFSSCRVLSWVEPVQVRGITYQTHPHSDDPGGLGGVELEEQVRKVVVDPDHAVGSSVAGSRCFHRASGAEVSWRLLP